MTVSTTGRARRRKAGLQAVLAWLTASQALTVSAWDADNIAAAAKIQIPGPGRPPKPPKRECTCQGGDV
jgi:hypothetical protein